ncbi:sugar ABC transporter permease [Terrarubrum flagellatum]|uniref:carbohydrate ABC transporter permease n=1 Tax=Terrirubrum flagellatum TaxID=2895980 RepID=UPI0031451916
MSDAVFRDNLALAQPVAPPAARKKRDSSAPTAALLLAPSLLFLALFTYAPILQALTQAFTIEKFGGKFAGYGFGNFQRLFFDAAFQKAFANTFLYGIGTVAPSLVIAVILAAALQESTRFNNLLRTIFFFPTLLPLVAAAALGSFVLMPGAGLLDYYLAQLGAAQTNWLGDPDIALYSIIGLTIWKNAGYYMLFALAGLQGIPSDIHEAAKLDGAGPITRFFRITLPLLMPTLAVIVVIALINVVTQVDHVIVLTGGGPSDSTNVLLNYIFQAAHEQHDIGRGAAATIVSVALLLALSFVSLKTLERGMHYES